MCLWAANVVGEASGRRVKRRPLPAAQARSGDRSSGSDPNAIDARLVVGRMQPPVDMSDRGVSMPMKIHLVHTNSNGDHCHQIPDCVPHNRADELPMIGEEVA